MKSKKSSPAASLELPVVPIEATEPDREAIRESFIDLVGERFGYVLGKKSLTKNMNDATKADRKTATETAKAISENLEKLVAANDEEARVAVKTKRVELKAQRKAISDATKPTRDEMKPLSEAIKYMDTIAIPDGLTELGKPVEVRLKLSDEMQKQLEAEKAKKD